MDVMWRMSSRHAAEIDALQRKLDRQVEHAQFACAVTDAMQREYARLDCEMTAARKNVAYLLANTERLERELAAERGRTAGTRGDM